MTKRKEAIAAALEQRIKIKSENRLRDVVPYQKQQEFFEAGATYRERCLSSGNQQGKSFAGAVEMAMHLTGEYPAWWTGRRWDHPIKAWACGVSSQVVRDVQQSKLCGEPGIQEAHGTGLLPKSCFVGNPSRSHGISDAYDTIHIRHKSGGVSVLTMKAYEQQRPKFQGSPVDLIWMDEEGDIEIYMECLTRTNATKGMIYTTYTPVNGRTALWERFSEPSPDRIRISMTILDALHISPEERQKIIDSYAPHERDCRVSGTPWMGSGRIFITPEQSISEPAIKYVPPHWKKLWGIDPGIAHPFAAVLSAWDLDTDCIHILHAFRISDQTPLQHAVQMKQIGINVPVAWPPDTGQREKGSGETLASLYKKQGLSMCPSHATFEDGGYSTEMGYADMDDRFKTGRLLVAAHLSDWFEEYRFLHRDKGLIVKERDDIMSATRICVMAKRMGRPVVLGNRKPFSNAQGGEVRIAAYTELSGDDLF